jgi:hypothetical protein
VAAVLRIADLLADGPRSTTELAVAADADPDGLDRLLRLLAGRGIFVAVAEAAEQVAAAGLAGRCQTVAGSYFQAVPADGDVYVLAYVLHCWDDPHAREILGAVRHAMPEHGRLLVVEEVLAPPNQLGGKMMDLLMAAVGGRERTEQEWRVLLADSGFQLTKIRP